MNLKEAFRYQNKLGRLMEDAESILYTERNVTKVENTLLCHKVNPDAADEVTVEPPATEYADRITQVAAFLMYLLDQRAKLSEAIHKAKAAMDFDFDGEVSLNNRRQQIAAIFRRMGQIRGSEVLLPGGGTGYKFNAEGNQVAYRCDLKKVTTINFDRNKVRAYAAALNREADAVSAQLDMLTVNTRVDYTAPFDVNDSFADILQDYMAQNG